MFADHKPLIAIQKKPINTASKRLERMMLCLQRFDLNLTYKPGKEMYIADALSRALPRQSKISSTSHFCNDLETVNFVEDLPISDSTLAKFQVETAKDESLQVCHKLYALVGLRKLRWYLLAHSPFSNIEKR